MPSENPTGSLNLAQPPESRRREPAWWAKCRERYQLGATVEFLADEFDREPKQVRLAINADGRLERERERQRAIHIPSVGKRTSHNTSMVEPRSPRAVRRIIADPETIRLAAERFARGKIGRDQLMKVVRGEARV